MVFQSILFERAQDSITAEVAAVPGTVDVEQLMDAVTAGKQDQPAEDDTTTEPPAAPPFFIDLNLDQVVDAITVAKQEYSLEPFFYTALHTVDAIEYRHQIFRDLEDRTLVEYIKTFAQQMHRMREHLAQVDKLRHRYQKERWFLDAVEIYCDAVNGLVHDLSLVELQSRGFLAFREYLTSYANSDGFMALVGETKKLIGELATVKYRLHIKGSTVRVRKPDSEVDYGTEIQETFEKFKEGAVKDYTVEFPDWQDMNHVEAQILGCVARLYAGIFSDLDNYCANNRTYLDEVIGVFDREIQFYVAYVEYLARFKREGLKFCYPQISAQDKQVYSHEGFDLALAHRLIIQKSPIVDNDFYLQDRERILVVSGPNQGGKTTFARTFGQLHYLASLGCPVPGREAQLFLFDELFTHFEKEEDIQQLRGQLEDDLVRIHSILDQATTNSIIIMNEIFTSTTLSDAIFLSKEVMERILQLDLLCVWVTFIDELASLSEKTVSMVSTVVPENPALRTYKIVRRPADGLAYAISIAERYRLTRDWLRERI